VKAVILAALIAGVGCAGGWVHREKGVGTRGAVKRIEQSAAAFDNEPDDSNERLCMQKLGLRQGCRIHEVESADTMTLLIGDSHARMAWRAIENFNTKQGVSTLLIADGGPTNSITGFANRSNECLTEKDKEWYTAQNELFQFIEHAQKIHKIFVILRGMYYIAPANTVDDAKTSLHAKKCAHATNQAVFHEKLQRFVDRMTVAGKEVFIVAENPELPFQPRNFLPTQPFRPAKTPPLLKKTDVLQYQQPYLETLWQIKNATIIPALDVFCPGETCQITDEQGLSLYLDDDHLSPVFGGNFLVNKILKPYLEAPPKSSPKQ
jgi:hypothetical protein